MLITPLSERTTTSFGKDADVVNLLLVGSPDQVSAAFAAAGWLPNDRNSVHAFLREFGAFLTYSSYPTMPVSRQFLDGRVQDLARQKSLDSYGRREHVRLWQEGTLQGQQAWLGAFTRETSATLSLKYHKFIHHVDRNLDEGVLMLIRDLSLAACVASVRQLPRPDMAKNFVNATGDEIRTDGTLNVVYLKECGRPALQALQSNPEIPIRPRSKVARYVRTEVLVYKSDVVRGNLFYGDFDLVRMGVRSLRHRHEMGEDPDNLPLSPVSPETLFPQTTFALISQDR